MFEVGGIYEFRNIFTERSYFYRVESIGTMDKNGNKELCVRTLRGTTVVNSLYMAMNSDEVRDTGLIKLLYF